MREELLDVDCVTAGWGTHSLGSLIPGRSIIITNTMISTMIMACLGYVQLCRLLQKVAAPLMERADCEERLEVCQGPRPLGCPPLAVRIFGHGLVANFPPAMFIYAHVNSHVGRCILCWRRCGSRPLLWIPLGRCWWTSGLRWNPLWRGKPSLLARKYHSRKMF